MLNAGHSLLAYRGLLRGHRTIAGAMADPDCAAALEQLWREARPVLPFESDEVDAALDALRTRFSNARIEHLLAQIATDGSQKLPLRILDVIRRRIDAGLPVGRAQAGVLAAWAIHLSGPDRQDPRADQLADQLAGRSSHEQAAAVVAFLAPDRAGDAILIAAVAAQIDVLVSHPQPIGTS
ncbi:MAG: mannitol dehydrogenase family protein [Lacisediminihabitans sp.]